MGAGVIEKGSNSKPNGDTEDLEAIRTAILDKFKGMPKLLRREFMLELSRLISSQEASEAHLSLPSLPTSYLDSVPVTPQKLPRSPSRETIPVA